MNKEDMDRLMAPDPETIVDRLRGIYTKNKIPIAGQYKTSPLHHEAANEIERLRRDAERYQYLRNLGEPNLCACIHGRPSYLYDTPGNSGKRLDDAIDAELAEMRQLNK